MLTPWHPELMRTIFGLRYDIYCLECGYLPQAQFPDGLETDGFDASSGHFYALDKRDQLIGYVRLVPGDEDGKFPFDRHGMVVFDTVERPDPAVAGEISRLMVHKSYRRRRGDTLAGVTVATGEPPVEERRNSSPQIMLCMFRQMYAHSVMIGTRYWYAAMERPLAKALTRMGFPFKCIGPETDYYGAVAPYLADLRQLELTVGRANPGLLAWLQGDLPG